MQKANAFCMEKMRLGCAHNLCAKGAQIMRAAEAIRIFPVGKAAG